MNTWVQDYATFTTAIIAILWSAYNTITQAKREREFKAGEWLRQMRMPRYASFIRAANEYEDAVFFQYANHVPGFHGPLPKEIPDLPTANKEFQHQLWEVTLVGPPEVAVAAQYVQYSIWDYSHRLESDPQDWDQKPTSLVMDQFNTTARNALDVASEAAPALKFLDWRKSLRKND